jgi:hypothetical protein
MKSLAALVPFCPQPGEPDNLKIVYNSIENRSRDVEVSGFFGYVIVGGCFGRQHT